MSLRSAITMASLVIEGIHGRLTPPPTSCNARVARGARRRASGPERFGAVAGESVLRRIEPCDEFPVSGADGSETHHDRLLILCSQHGRLAYEGGFAIQRNGEGAHHITRPDGRPVDRAYASRTDRIEEERPSNRV